MLRFQFGTLKIEEKNNGRGQHRKYLPYVYTEQGISMLAGILKNDIAINI
ncbi:MAG: ORF6N domain-containing protein [Clostridia bacterium]|nr:ORF6N domain-containing protein [Clostridia bacterium]